MTFFVSRSDIFLLKALIILLFSFTPYTYAAPTSLDNLLTDDYAHIIKTTNDITAKSPLESHYVGIGRSPTPIITYFQSISNEMATNLPISKFRYNSSTPAESLTPSQEVALNKYFKDKLGFLEGQRINIVFIDYLISGKSLLSVKHYYDKFRLQNPSMPEASMHFLLPWNKIHLLYKIKHSIVSGSFFKHLKHSQYDDFARSGYVTITDIYRFYSDEKAPLFENTIMHSRLVKKLQELNNSHTKTLPRSCINIFKRK